MDYRVISIGTLSVHELWQQQGPARTPHATTTLVRSGDRRILVDPGLPPQVITARLAERSGLSPEDISDVFLTNFRPSHRWGITAFPNARWLIHEPEREQIGQGLIAQFQESEDEEQRKLLEREIALLKKCENAPDSLAPHVDLFPLPGFTPGTCGLILSQPQSTILIAGDAVATAEHLEAGRVLRHTGDVDKARESLAEAIEIADAIICGHDNLVLNPTRRFGA
ncbi:MAG: MBL fold metallo-hydrolase [Phycisphaeraceae bacterium]